MSPAATSGSMGSLGGGMHSSDEGSKKIRKAYTISKARESWTEQEHDKFLEALQLFDRDWKRIESFVGTKTVIQIRSHAQKYFLKVEKYGTGAHVPPPRPKRKSAQPYPQKAPKSALQAGVMGRTLDPQPTQSEPCLPRHGAFQSSSIGSNCGSWQHHSMPPVGQDTPDLRGDIPVSAIKPAPDFAGVYTFIGNVFDLDSSGHLKDLKEMAPIDRETVLLLMRNLSLNLSNPEFGEDKRSLLPCDVNAIESRQGRPDHYLAGSIPPAADLHSDGGEDDTAVSGQPAPNCLSESLKSDSHLDPRHGTPEMPSYPKGVTGTLQQCGQPYDGGSRSGGSALPINPYLPVMSSRTVLDLSAMGLHQTARPHSSPVTVAFDGGRGFAMPLPALTAGVGGDPGTSWG